MVDGEDGWERGVRVGSAVLTTLDNFHMYLIGFIFIFLEFNFCRCYSFHIDDGCHFSPHARIMSFYSLCLYSSYTYIQLGILFERFWRIYYYYYYYLYGIYW